MHIYFLLLMLVVIGLVVWQISKRLRGHCDELSQCRTLHPCVHDRSSR